MFHPSATLPSPPHSEASIRTWTSMDEELYFLAVGEGSSIDGNKDASDDDLGNDSSSNAGTSENDLAASQLSKQPPKDEFRGWN